VNSLVFSARAGVAAFAPAVSGLQPGVAGTSGNVLPGVNLVATANTSGRFDETRVTENRQAAASPQPARLKAWA